MQKEKAGVNIYVVIIFDHYIIFLNLQKVRRQ